MKILIIEDEIPAAKRLEKLISECRPDAQILSVIDTVEDALDWFRSEEEPDLVISDIQLADGISFQIYEELNLECPIIFSTAYDQYAIKAFELNCIDYLLKPYSKDALQKSFDKLDKFSPIQQNFLKELDLTSLVKQFSNGNVYKQRFLISKADALIPISIEEIAYIYTEDKAVMIKTIEDKSFFINYSLDDLENQLDPAKFFRLNRQFITSIRAISKISQYFNGKLKVELKPVQDGKVIVSRAKTPLFKSWLEK
ncbi:MAG: DNA-binding response regulator [Flavobacteriales bacterium]|nr:DNA-binding response regulator [Flavobacteriales bacterium]